MTVLRDGDPGHARAQQRLRSEPIGWLTTAGGDAQPQSTPVWFHWDGERFLMFSQPGKPKLRNIAANPKVSLHLDGDRTGGDNVVFEGLAEIRGDAAPADQAPEYIDKYRALIDSYGWTPESFASDYSVPIRITPTRARIW